MKSSISSYFLQLWVTYSSQRQWQNKNKWSLPCSDWWNRKCMKLNRHKNYQIVSLICDVSNVDFVEVKNKKIVTRGNLGSGVKESFVSAFKVIEKNKNFCCVILNIGYNIVLHISNSYKQAISYMQIQDLRINLTY